MKPDEFRKATIENLIIEHMNIIKDLVTLIDPDVNYFTSCWIKHDNEDTDYYSFDSTNPDEKRIINFNKFI